MLGPDSFGLLGWYTTLVGSLSILDMGLSNTFSRELARDSSNIKENVRNLFYSLERIYWLTGLGLCAILILSSNFIANYWITSSVISHTDLIYSICLMGVLLAFQWPQSIYSGAYLGIQKLDEYNVILIVTSILKNGGAFLVLLLVQNSILAYLIWSVGINILMVLFMRYRIWSKIDNTNLKFSFLELAKIWKFASGMFIITLVSFALTQFDKLLLSKLFDLKTYGYYTLVFTVASGINLIGTMISSPLYPKLTNLVATESKFSVRVSYLKYITILSNIVCPLGIFVCIFSFELLSVWLNNNEIATAINVPVILMSVGFVLNCLMQIPYYLTLAYGWTRFTIVQNIIAIALFIPTLYILSTKYGMEGASFTWAALNAGYLLISLPILHHFILKGSLKEIYLKSILLPVLITFPITYILHYIYIFNEFNELSRLVKVILFLIIMSIIYILLYVINTNFRKNIDIKKLNII